MSISNPNVANDSYLTDVVYGPDNESVTVAVVGLDSNATGDVGLATVSVVANAHGTADVTVTDLGLG